MLTSKALRHAAPAIALGLISIASAFAATNGSPDNSPHTPSNSSKTQPGYYRSPAIHGDTIVFGSEGDLWSVPVQGGLARRLTSNSGLESMPAISPDGQTLAFAAQYEGPREVYTMPLNGGVPERRTWDGDAHPQGWTPDGRLIVGTGRYSTLPGSKIVLIGNKGQIEILPLSTAAEGAYSSDGHTLFFTRWNKQSSSTKRYKGGTAENLWRFNGQGEATPLTADYEGTSHNPMFWNGRVYFLSDRDGIMNVWSMNPEGKELKQESHQKIFDVQTASISDGRVAYSSGADIWLLDLKTSHEEIVPIRISSDYDQLREHWTKKPLDYLTGFHISPDGSSAVFTARGEVFTLPAAKTGRTIKIADGSAVRYRDARFLPDGKSILAISTESGETEFWQYPANGIGKAEQWTNDSKVQRTEGVPSPDGKWLAHHDRDQQLWIYDIKNKTEKRIGQSMYGDFGDLSWSPDSRWLSYGETAANQFQQIKILNVETGAIQAVTSDRYNSGNPTWTPDGKWLYYLSDRSLKTTVPSPWGARQPDPHFDHTVKIYQLALNTGLRSPFLPYDELHPEDAEKKEEDKKEEKKEEKKAEDAKKTDGKSTDAAKKDAEKADKDKADKDKDSADDKKKPAEVKIDFTDLASRLSEVPVPAGNYNSLQTAEKRLCWLDIPEGAPDKSSLECLDIANKGDEPDTVMSGVGGYEISADHKKMLVQKDQEFYILDSDTKSTSDSKMMGKAAINFARWSFSTDTRQEFRGLFLDAWRMHRDYFYDRHMHGVDWPAMRDRYLPLVDRVSNRDELNNVIDQMVGELSVLHTFVFGGDQRQPEDDIDLAGFGAQLRRDEKAGGYVVEHVYLHDPDLPNEAPPFARPDSHVADGEIIVSINGQPTLSVPDERVLLRGKAGSPVLLGVKSATGTERQLLVTPISTGQESNLRYSEWEYSRRIEVEKSSNEQIGYVHLRAMGSGDIDQWARDYYPIFNRQGLIIDVRHNGGGNIDSWLLGKLLRQAWMYWQPRVGAPSWNMQGAFRGHIVVLCDENTGSDGEAFTEGIKRLKLGKVIGTRTWGGEVWLGFDNQQADNGIATAPEIGVYGPEGKWLIEGRGVEPDITVENLPHAGFTGSDAQLQSALDLLKQEIQQDPRPVPNPPPYPDKSFKSQK
ncbi:S41 family peptidase [Acidicapsa ligni]|uniref:S41 family peptidase n=1 Tax=Acidicapsa ligni TaxID=542300 RepID=UPI0021DFF243|nr:S41 family peptidase [Acidicapsa ligni]